MKNRSYFLSVILALFACAFLMGCQEKTPVKLVRSELNQIQHLDEETIQSFIPYEDLLRSDVDAEDRSDATEAVQLFFQNFSYEILSSTVLENSATVNVEITNIDAKALAKDLCLEILMRSVSPDQEEEAASSTKISYFLMLHDILSEKDYDLVTNKVRVDLTKGDGNWVIENTDELEDALVGGFITCLQDPYLVTPQEITEHLFQTLADLTPEEWRSYLNMSDIFSTYSSLYPEVDLALATQLALRFSYEIKNVQVTDDKASAQIAVTSLDMKAVLDDYLTQLLDYASTTEAVRASDIELADKTAALLKDSLEENTAVCTKTVTIAFTNNGTSWEIELDSDFTDAILGGMNDAVEDFQESASSTWAEK